MRSIVTKRIYLAPAVNDGFRVLVDRVWPRGMTKDHAAIDLWCKEIAPSADLRKWFNHEPEKWPQFRLKYREELHGQTEILQMLLDREKDKNLTLLYSAKDTEHNQAVVLQEILLEIGKTM